MMAPEIEVEVMKIMLWWKIEVGSWAWFRAVHKVRNAIFGQFQPPYPWHTSSFVWKVFVRGGFYPYSLLLKYICYNRKLKITLNFMFHISDKNFFISVTSHALDPHPSVTNCHTFSDPLPLERDVLYGQPLLWCPGTFYSRTFCLWVKNSAAEVSFETIPRVKQSNFCLYFH